MKNYLFVCILVLFSSCIDNTHKNEIKLLMSKKVNLELNLHSNEKDSVIKNDYKNKFTLVVYLDKEQCTQCVIDHLYVYDSFMESHKYLNYSYIFSIDKKNYNAINRRIKVNNIQFPITIDTSATFERLNPHIPNNPDLHTFLLDEENNVIFVGDPIWNIKSRKLMYKKINKNIN